MRRMIILKVMAVIDLFHQSIRFVCYLREPCFQNLYTSLLACEANPLDTAVDATFTAHARDQDRLALGSPKS